MYRCVVACKMLETGGKQNGFLSTEDRKPFVL